MYYNLSDPFQAQQASTRLESLITRKAIIELTEKKQRTLPQNAYLHVCLGCVGLKVGHPINYIKQVYYKRYCNPDIYIRRQYDKKIEQEVEVVRSSRDLTKEEMSLSIERFRNFSMMICDEYLPTPEDHAWISSALVEVERASAFLGHEED